MLIGLDLVKLVVRFKPFKNILSHAVTVLAGHKAEAFHEYAHIVNRHNLREIKLQTQLIVLNTAAGSYMHNACSFIGGNLVPGYDLMLNACLSLDFREAGLIMQAHKLGALNNTKDLQLVVAEP